jgi:peroxiredoxin family protein
MEMVKMPQDKLALIVNSASYDRVAYALSIATVSAAQFTPVHVLFTYGAIIRLIKEHTDRIGIETEGWLQPQVIMGRDDKTIPQISEMLSHLKGFGGKIYACTAAMALHEISKEELIDEVDDVLGIASFLQRAESADLLYI